MKNRYVGCHCLIALFATGFAASAVADDVVVAGKIVDEDRQPIVAASISIAGKSENSDEFGKFAFALSKRDVYVLKLSSPGHYSFIHTISRADVSSDQSGRMTVAVPAITLVRKEKGRRLFVFAGDTMMGRRFITPRNREPALIKNLSAIDDAKRILKHAKPYLELAEFASVNLETQLSDAPLTEPLAKSVTFYSPASLAEALHWAGVDYVALGNNHLFDYQDAGLRATLRALQAAGLGFSGAGPTDAIARQPYSTSLEGQAIDLLSYVGWPGGKEPNQVAGPLDGGAALGTSAAIAQDLLAIPRDSMTVLQYHSGLEYVSRPPLAEETQLKLAIDRGADLAIGHHSHVFQGFEIYKEKLLAYSLGNFVFDQYLYSTQSSILLFVWYDGDDFYRAEVVPMHLNGYVPTPATGSIRYDILQRLVRLSDAQTVCWSHSGVHAAFQRCTQDGLATAAQDLIFSDSSQTETVIPLLLSSQNADPLRPIRSVQAAQPYRLGVDILRRGDFEYVGLFGTHDRTWIEDERVSYRDQESMLMNLELGAGETLTTGMRVFTRVFTRSAPATVSLKVRTSGCAKFRFYLQRRTDQMAFEEALDNGPVEAIGEFTVSSPSWSSRALDFNLPRTFTRGIRLLVDVDSCVTDGSSSEIQIDDLALTEWQTPWHSGGEELRNSAQTQATHLQFQTSK